MKNMDGSVACVVCQFGGSDVCESRGRENSTKLD